MSERCVHCGEAMAAHLKFGDAKAQMAEIIAIFTHSEALKQELEKGAAITLTITTKRAHQ